MKTKNLNTEMLNEMSNNELLTLIEIAKNILADRKSKENEAMNEFKNIHNFRSKAFNKSNAFYSIEKDGQEDPAKGDRVCVKLRIYLPCEEVAFGIKKDLRFNRRVLICGIPLWRNWGEYNDDEDCRFQTKVFFSESWREAFVEAKKYAEQEIEKLEEAIRNREEALQRAEDD